MSRHAREALALLMVLGVALALRLTALDVPHLDSDEPWNEGLAASILEDGSYTLRHVDIALLESDRALALVRLDHDRLEYSGVLRFYGDQRSVVDAAVSFRAPLYPLLLAASAKTLGTGKLEVVARAPGAPREPAYAQAVSEPTRGWRGRQLPVVSPSLLASLVAVVLGFVAARTIGASLVASTFAALTLAVAPLEVWCAHRVTADTLTEALVGASVLVLALAPGVDPRKGIPRAAVAGLLGGLAVLAKSSGVLLLPAVALAEGAFFVREREAGRPADLRGALLRTSTFAGVLVLLGLWWPVLIACLSGSLGQALGYGGVGLPHEALGGSWPTFTRARPFWVPFASTLWLSPLLGIGALVLPFQALRALAENTIRSAESDARERRIVLLSALALVFLVATAAWPSKENRFLLPGYVPFAAGTALLVDMLVARARTRRSTKAALPLIALVLAAALVLSAIRARALGPSGLYELCPVGGLYPGA